MKESKSTSMESARKTEAKSWAQMGVPIDTKGKTIKVGMKSMKRMTKMRGMKTR